MDPSNPASFNHRTERLATGRTYHFVDQVPQEYDPVKTPTLLCVHGFPDLWYGWRHCIVPWVQKCGFRVVVPSMLGYGGSDKPVDPEHYSMKRLSDDLAALLDVIGVQKAVVLGHDWGAATVWRFALWHPDRVRALIPLSIPFTPRRPEYISIEQIAERLPVYGYQLYFSDPNTTKEIGDHLTTFFSLLYSRAGKSGREFLGIGQLRSLVVDDSSQNGLNLMVTSEEFQYYLDNFKKGGMNGPLNYYRTTKHRFEEEAAGELATHLPASLPVLFIFGETDRTCPHSQVERMNVYIPSLRIVQVPEIGHWLMLEAPDVVVNNVADFVREVCTETGGSKL